MKLQVLYTERYFNEWPTWPLIYEWVDLIALSLNLELADSLRASVTTFYLDKVLRVTSRNIFGDNRMIIFADKLVNKRLGLYFELLPRTSFYFTGSKNTVPIIIDFSRTTNLKLFYNAYKNCKAVFISNLQAFIYLKQCKCPLNIYHLPQSIADKYKITADTSFKKTFELIIPGRVDSILLGYLKEYEEKFPNVEYLYRDYINEEFMYISNKTGIRYRGQDRQEYMALLRASKVTLYSTVGIDGDEARTGGFSPVTPRFLEMVSAGCHVIARYPINEETKYFELDKICTSCDSYSLFENELSKALNGDGPDMKLYESYLEKHYTSKRIEELKSILAEID
jgi:hypothetical protein